MAKTGDVVIRIRVDDKDAPTKLAALKRTIEGLQGKGGGVGKTGLDQVKVDAGSASIGMFQFAGAIGLAVTAGQLLIQAGEKIGEMFLEVGKSAFEAGKYAVETADKFEMIRIRLTQLRGGEAGAAAAMEWIKEFARETPYEVEQISNAAVTLEAFGLKFEDNIKAVGDAASMMGVPIEHAAELFGRFSTGMYSQRFLAQLGLSKKKLHEWGLEFDNAGQLIGNADDAYAKFLKGIESERGGLMAAMMTTVEGKLSNIKDYFSQIAAGVGDELSPVVKMVLDDISSMLANILDSDRVVSAVSVLADAFEDNYDIIESIIGIIPEVVEWIEKIIVVVAEVINTWADWERTAQESGGSVVSGLDLVHATLDTIAFSLIWVIKYFEHFGKLFAAFAAGDPAAIARVIAATLTMGATEVVAATISSAEEAADALEMAEGRIADKARRRAEEKTRGHQRKTLAENIRNATDEQIQMMVDIEPGLRGTTPAQARAWADRFAEKPWEGMGRATDTGGGGEKKEGRGELEDRVRVLQDRIREAQEKFEERVRLANEIRDAFDEVDKQIDKTNKALDDAIRGNNRNLAEGITGAIRSGFEGGWKGVGQWFVSRLEEGVFNSMTNALTEAFASKMLRESLAMIPGIGPFLSILGLEQGGIVRGGRGGVVGMVGEGPHSELYTPATATGITNLIKGVAGAIGTPALAPTFIVESTDPNGINIYERTERGRRTLFGRTW